MAEYNGLEKYTHTLGQLAWMAQVTEAFKVMTPSACMFPQKEEGYLYKDNFHEMCMAQDICDGIVADPIDYRAWENPQKRSYIEKYLAGKQGVSTEVKLKPSDTCMILPVACT